MPWWGWVLVWVALLVFAAVVFTVLGLSLWRRIKALYREVGEVSERLAVVSDQLQTLSQRSPESQDPAVFESPSQLRQARVKSRRPTRGSESRSQRLR